MEAAIFRATAMPRPDAAEAAAEAAAGAAQAAEAAAAAARRPAVRRRLPQLLFKGTTTVEAGGGSGGGGGATAKRYTAYVLQVSLLGHSWELTKRYSDFDELRKQLESAYVPSVIPRGSWPAFPAKRILNNLDANLVQSRSAGLQSFMQALLHLSPVCDDRLLLKFLEAPASSLTSSAIDAGRRRFAMRVAAWHAEPTAPTAAAAVDAPELADWAWQRGLENLDLAELWSRFAESSTRMDPRAPRAATLAQSAMRGRRVRRQLQAWHSAATRVQQFVRQRRLCSEALLADDGAAVMWELQGIAHISPAHAPSAPMFRCSSVPFCRLGHRWELCAQIDRSADSVGIFLRELGVAPSGGEPRAAVCFALQLVANGAGGSIVLAEHQSENCRFRPEDDEAGSPRAGWGKLRMASLQSVRSTALWSAVCVRLVLADDAEAVARGLEPAAGAGDVTPTRPQAQSGFETPPTVSAQRVI